jgi:hypothetical protein
MRWPILAGWVLLASPTAALADEPQYACAKPAPDAKLTIQFTPDLTLRELGAWVTGFTCKSVVYDGEAAARATKLALIAPSAVTPRQAVKLFTETLQKAGLAVAEQTDTFVISLDPSVRRPCTRPGAPRTIAAPAACARPGAAKLSVSFKPDATLDDLGVWVSGLACKRVSFDPAIAPQATRIGVIVSAQLAPRQAVRLFVDAVEATGLTVAERDGAYEVKPGPRWAHCAAAAPGGAGTAAPPPPPGGAGTAAPVIDVDAELDGGLRKIDDTHYEMKRSLLEKVMNDAMTFMQGARIVPSMKNGQPNGFKIFSVRPSSSFARVGLLNGDTVQTLNGISLSEPDKALGLYASLRDAQRIVIGLERRGVPMTVTITILK